VTGESIGPKVDLGLEDRAHDVVLLIDARVGAVFDPREVSSPRNDAFGE
jgi:hypothetical protein